VRIPCWEREYIKSGVERREAKRRERTFAFGALIRKEVLADRRVLEKAEERGRGKKREKKKEIWKEVLMEKLMVRERASVSGRVVTLVVVVGVVVVIDFVALDDDTFQSPGDGFPTSRRSTQRLGNSRLVDVETRLRRIALVSPLCLPPRPDLMMRNRTKRLERASLNTRPS